MSLLDVVCEDGPVLAVNKPAGLLTQGPPAAVDTLEIRAKQYLREKYQKPGNVYLGVPHRLDRWVSGVVVFARNSKSAARLAEQFRERRVRKFYWAVVRGCPEPAQGTWVDWVEKLPDQAKGRVVPEPVEKGGEKSSSVKRAELRYRVLRSVELGDVPATLLEIELLTGRYHQIRLQLSSRGFPIYRDVLYQDSNDLESPLPADEGPIALHARRLELWHPVRYDALVLEAPLPEHFPG